MQNQVQNQISVEKDSNLFQVAPGVYGLRILFVNVYFINEKGDNSGRWLLIDGGLKGSAKKIIEVAENLFGAGSKPEAIILTHGHFDHVGSIEELVEQWNVQVYAHKLELPYLTGKSSYPPADPTVGGGALAFMSWMFPNSPKNLNENIKSFPSEKSLLDFKDWQIIQTPGHSPGHVSLFRKKDGLLITGDAFVTVQQESALSVMMQTKEVCGPPKYFTINWQDAYLSVKKLAELSPSIAACGHGLPMEGEELTKGITNLSNNFIEVAVPKHGRYVRMPARMDENGVSFLPPENSNIKTKVLTLAIFGALAGYGAALLIQKKERRKKAKNESY